MKGKRIQCPLCLHYTLIDLSNNPEFTAPKVLVGKPKKKKNAIRTKRKNKPPSKR